MRVPSIALVRVAWPACMAVLAVSGCDVFDDSLAARLDEASAARTSCRVHADCAAREACVAPAGRCVPLASEDCKVVTGQLDGADTIVLGSLFSTSGSQAATNLARQQSAILAIEELNRAGGIPAAQGGPGRSLVLVSCDEAEDLERAGRHLIDTLRVPAIIGPNTSQDVIDLSNDRSVAGGTLLLSPTGVASSIHDLADQDLTWTMVPADEQRAPLMKQQIGELETQLLRDRKKERVKLSIIHRDDALGVGTRTSLNTLVLNGKPLSDELNLGAQVKFGAYRVDEVDDDPDDENALVDAHVAFAPDIVVLAGTAEIVTQIMQPLEQRWGAGPRPFYVLIDSGKVPELIELAAKNDDLRTRVRGTGVVPSVRTRPVYDSFRVAYEARFPGSPATISGMGPSYDATYAIAYALAATRAEPVSGRSIATGLRMLSGGTVDVPIESTKIVAAMAQLTAGKPVRAIGTFAPLAWDARGAPIGGTIEVWCIASSTPTPTYRSSGLTLDLETQALAGRFQPCSP